MQSSLEKKLQQVHAIFDVKSIISTELDKGSIEAYYKKNFLAYRLFHNRTGFLHMGISTAEKAQDKDYCEQANQISSLIAKHKLKNILELASGQGANLQHLASRHRDVTFYGIDLSTSPNRQILQQPNISFSYGDYHNLSQFKDESLDLIYVIEALCHTTTPEIVFSQVHKKLRKDGLFVIFDGYYTNRSISPTEKIACELVEKSMAVNTFQNINDIVKITEREHFRIIEQTDLSKNVLPSMRKIERLAKHLFKHRVISKILSRVFPSEIFNNAIAGYLMPDLIEYGIATYYKLIIQK